MGQCAGRAIDNTIATGSRTPIAGVPAWATLEMLSAVLLQGICSLRVQCAITSSNYCPIVVPVGVGERLSLNGFYLTDEGFRGFGSAHLRLFRNRSPGRRSITRLAWLLHHDQSDLARSPARRHRPFLSQLRFYPRPVDQPRRFGSQVYVQDVGPTLDGLRKIHPNPQILAQKEAIEVWTPLFDQTVILFLETLNGEPPLIDGGQRGSRRAQAVVGGWPCQVYPAGWSPRAEQLLVDYAAKRRAHRLCSKPERKEANFYQLRQFLGRCVDDWIRSAVRTSLESDDFSLNALHGGAFHIRPNL